MVDQVNGDRFDYKQVLDLGECQFKFCVTGLTTNHVGFTHPCRFQTYPLYAHVGIHVRHFFCYNLTKASNCQYLFMPSNPWQQIVIHSMNRMQLPLNTIQQYFWTPKLQRLSLSIQLIRLIPSEVLRIHTYMHIMVKPSESNT